MPAAGFSRIDHTADVGFALRAPALGALFVVAAEALNSLWNQPQVPVPADEAGERVEVTGDDWESLLVAWLNELVFRADAEARIAVAVREPHVAPPVFRANVVWRPMDPAAAADGVDVKAATYHMLEIREVPGGYETTVIFDT